MSKYATRAGALVAFALAWLMIGEASATTPAPGPGEFRVCLKADMTGLVDRNTGTRGTGAEWALYGVNYRVEKGSNVVQNWTYADANDGCFILDDGIGEYTIKVRPRSTTLDGNNTVRVNNSSGALKTYSVVTPTIGIGQATYEVTMPSKAVLRIYSVLAFATERAFRGLYANADMIGWKEKASGSCNTSSCTDPCTVTCTLGGEPNIVIDGDHHTRKFVVAHEYGHATLRVGVGQRDNRCDVLALDPAGADGHYLRGREASSCAAVEGFAHFVSGDVFNWHNSGTGSDDPQAEVKYVDDGVWNLGGGTGSCPTYPIAAVSATNNARKLYLDCANGTSDPSEGIEMDWARLWWDYHEDTKKPGNARGHSQIHSDIAAGGAWGASDAYETIIGGLSTSLADRFDNAAAWNGVCEGSSC